MYMFMVF